MLRRDSSGVDEVPEDVVMQSCGPSRMVKSIGKRSQQAWTVSGPGKLSQTEHLIPWPQPGEILIRIRAVGISGSDLAQVDARFVAPAGSTDIPGLEVAGEVAAVGKGVSDWAEGDRLCCLITGGGFAFFCVCPAELCLPIPTGFSWEMTAALPVGLSAAWSCLFELGNLERGQTVLIHGGAGGVGHLMIQVAVAFGVRVITTCSSKERSLFCASLGAEENGRLIPGRSVFCASLGAEPINRTARNFVDEVLEWTLGRGVELGIDCADAEYLHHNLVLEWTLGRGVDVVIDCAGAENLNQNLQAVSVGGRIVLLASLKPETNIDLQTVIDKQLTICGGSNRAREPAFRRYLTHTLKEKVWPLLENGQVKPVLHHVARIALLPAALDIVRKGGVKGKVCITVTTAS